MEEGRWSRIRSSSSAVEKTARQEAAVVMLRVARREAVGVGVSLGLWCGCQLGCGGRRMARSVYITGRDSVLS